MRSSSMYAPRVSPRSFSRDRIWCGYKRLEVSGYVHRAAQFTFSVQTKIKTRKTKSGARTLPEGFTAYINGIITAVENKNTTFKSECQLCDFLAASKFQQDAENILQEHLRDYHRVIARLMMRAPF